MKGKGKGKGKSNGEKGDGLAKDRDPPVGKSYGSASLGKHCSGRRGHNSGVASNRELERYWLSLRDHAGWKL